eukprot:scaffold2072_cov162-Amphora_coffeaeformis.AAC.5
MQVGISKHGRDSSNQGSAMLDIANASMDFGLNVTHQEGYQLLKTRIASQRLQNNFLLIRGFGGSVAAFECQMDSGIVELQFFRQHFRLQTVYFETRGITPGWRWNRLNSSGCSRSRYSCSRRIGIFWNIWLCAVDCQPVTMSGDFGWWFQSRFLLQIGF